VPSPAVPFFSPRGAAFGVDLGVCLQGVVDSGWYVLGPNVREFEQAFARYVGVGHAVGVANGTDALALALRALGIGPGQRVATVANAGCYASTAIAQVGAVPCFVDVDEGSLTLSPDRLRATLRDGPVGAVILTHLYGRMGEASAIAALCRQAGVPLIEDCAQAHGAVRAGRQAGAWGAVACFSFYPTKNLGACGDAGLATANDPALADRIVHLRTYAARERYVHDDLGINSRLDEIQAAILRVKLRWLDRWTARRREIAARYRAGLAGSGIGLPAERPGDLHVYHQFTVRVADRDGVQRRLSERGVRTAIYYPVPLHLQPLYRELGYRQGDFPESERAAREVLCLPIYPELTDGQVDEVVAGVKASV